MAHFYDDLAAGCSKWYGDASNKFASDVEDYSTIINNVGAHKHMIMNYARNEFHTVKADLFTIVDSLIDSQRSIENVEEYFMGRIKYMNKRITADDWKYQLKYSTGVTKRCASEASTVENFEKKIDATNKQIAKKMQLAFNSFQTSASHDLHNWNCKEMYPEP